MIAPRPAALLGAAALALALPALAGPPPRPLDTAALKKAVARQKPAFDACLTKAARKIPKALDGKRALLRLTIAPSGRVGGAALDPDWLESQPVGRCLVDAGRRLVIAPFAGGAVDVDVPLRLSVSR